jgi:hypothetical protein
MLDAEVFEQLYTYHRARGKASEPGTPSIRLTAILCVCGVGKWRVFGRANTLVGTRGPMKLAWGKGKRASAWRKGIAEQDHASTIIKTNSKQGNFPKSSRKHES